LIQADDPSIGHLTPLFENIASEEVILELVGSKCLPILLYGLECYPLIKSELSSLDFVITRVLMKLFKSANVSLINDSYLFFKFLLPSEILEKRKQKFLHNFVCCANILRFLA